MGSRKARPNDKLRAARGGDMVDVVVPLRIVLGRVPAEVVMAGGRLARLMAAPDMVGPRQAAPRDLAGWALTAIRRRFAAMRNVIHQPHRAWAIAVIDMVPGTSACANGRQRLRQDGNDSHEQDLNAALVHVIVLDVPRLRAQSQSKQSQNSVKGNFVLDQTFAVPPRSRRMGRTNGPGPRRSAR
jgi:hypothetical protein